MYLASTTSGVKTVSQIGHGYTHDEPSQTQTSQDSNKQFMP